ncbi:hypothetical protein Y5S_03015 [Alcanivorax nanhaiticus]|uniref:Uncharacterized protein n=1 Tax=Alcanivorax nanhaiticus TaxID=1177154 RepID=A0A095TN06_9GAMM|nr:ribosomal protein L7/L12 [Alcanivorax nanhaiticus]KGD63808.1 hypothetical protein Y5S_03015 [Alcanivorax nanhaiticus]
MRLPDNVEQVLRQESKIAAIKLLREEHNLGLREAKEWVENHLAETSPPKAAPAASGKSVSRQDSTGARQSRSLPLGRMLLAVIVVAGACLGYAVATGML